MRALGGTAGRLFSGSSSYQHVPLKMYYEIHGGVREDNFGTKKINEDRILRIQELRPPALWFTGAPSFYLARSLCPDNFPGFAR